MLDVLQPTPFDLRWRMFGIPVRVHPLFWLVALLLGPREDGFHALIWIVTVFVSILVHELGHALAAKAFGRSPAIILYSFGGLTISARDVTEHKAGREIVISCCGPLAGFILAVAIWGLLLANNAVPVFAWQDLLFGPRLLTWPEKESFQLLIVFLLYINVWWGLINLLPAYPLDGGHIVYYALTWFSPWQGARWTGWISIFTAVVIVLLAVQAQRIFLAVVFGMLAIEAYFRLLAHNRSD
jgi:stage IV sporulation protein FB